MKKALSLLLCTSLLLVGCQKQPDETIPSSVPATTGPAVTETAATEPSAQVPAYNAQLNAISMPVVTKSAAAEDGTVIFKHSYQSVHMTHQDPSIAKSVVLDLMNRIDRTSSDAEDVRSQAEQNYTGDSSWTPYVYQVAYHTQRIDSGVLSLLGDIISYAGGVHPNYINVSASYDLVSGQPLEFSDIVTADTTDELMVSLIADALAGRDDLFIGYEDIAADKFYHGFEGVTNWYFSPEGLCFYYSPYELAPYSAGTVVAEIPYSKLNGIIKDDYFPAERPDGAGNCVLVPFADADLSNFTHFTEFIGDKEAPQNLLYTDGLVYDIRLESGTGYESDDGMHFQPEATVFAASHLTSSDAVMIQASGLLRLTYRVGDEIITEYLGK